MAVTNRPSGNGLLAAVERIGNRLPDPVTLFVIGAFVVLITSEVAFRVGWSAENPTTGEIETVKSLLSGDGMQWVWRNLVSNFTGFAPLGVVLVAMIGIGVAERSGLIDTILKGTVLLTPQALLTPAVIFVGVMSSMALDAGYVVLPPLAAAVFARAGRSPLVGLAAVFSGIAAGFSANLLITGLDPLLQSFTQEAAQILDQNYQVDIRCNYYFMVASTIMITLVGWGATRLVVERRYSRDDVHQQMAAAESAETDQQPALGDAERRGLLWAGLALAAASGGILAMVLIEGGPLNGTIEPRPGWELAVWVDVIVPILFVLFLVPGLAYGMATRSIKSDRDVATMMNKTMSSMGPYIILAFFAAQFVGWFSESNLGKVIALEGVALLQSWQMPIWLLVISIVLLACLLNLFIGSASAKWALISTVFVPIFAGVGISPELTQAAYRIGDSVTNSISPLNPYVVIILVFMRQYEPKAGIGSLISLMLPYTIAFLIAWILLLIVWMGLGLPLGPGDSPLFIEPLESISAAVPLPVGGALHENLLLPNLT
ncbi:MAG TPA: AbgT family transporter [Pirellulaceae bacterium]|nr:AbgT family transporter [Pirellulaceae bacterium]